jgi:hypothetical protein
VFSQRDRLSVRQLGMMVEGTGYEIVAWCEWQPHFHSFREHLKQNSSNDLGVPQCCTSFSLFCKIYEKLVKIFLQLWILTLSFSWLVNQINLVTISYGCYQPW